MHQKQGNDQEQGANPYRDDCDNLGDVFHFLLQWAEFFFQGLRYLGNPTEVRVHAGGVNNCLAGAGGYEGASKNEVGDICAGDLLDADGFR